MALISQKKVREFLERARPEKKAKIKGQIFEDLICYIFEQVPGVSITRRNILNPYRSEEIDIGAWNEKAAAGLSFLPNTILIEAKN